MGVVQVSPETTQSWVMHRTLQQTPVVVERANGSELELSNGKKVIDACSGAAVACVGQGVEELIEAAAMQMRSVGYVHAGSHTTSSVEEFAELLLKGNPFQFRKVFFACSGSEAIEASLKLARQYFVEIGEPRRTRYISRRQSYHGNTLGALSVSDFPARRVQYEPLLATNVDFIESPNSYRAAKDGVSEFQLAKRLITDLENQVLQSGPDTIIAIIVETIAGTVAGCCCPPRDYLQGMRRICDKYGILLILDEIMCGTGRTGTFYAFEQEDVVPDIVTLGKGLAGGFAPLSAVVVRQNVVTALERGSGRHLHSHTYQSHPVSCAIGLSVQQYIRNHDLIARCAQMGQFLREMLIVTLDQCPHVGDIRGRGLFWAVEFVQDKVSAQPFDNDLQFAHRIQHAASERGVAVFPSTGTADGRNGDHIIVAPAYTIKKFEIVFIVEAIRDAYDDVVKQMGSQ